MLEDKHVIETLGKVRVVIENGEITEVGESEMKYCPMFHAMHKVDELNEEFIRKNINFRIEDFGMCTPDRVIEMDDAVTVGISEILKTNMEKGSIDCVVGACDGAGTLLMTSPRVVQGVGGRVSGLVSTTPIPDVIRRLEEKGSTVLDPIRSYPVGDDVNVYIFVAHTTGIAADEVEMLFENSDIVTACASKAISDYADEHKPYYYGVKVPIFCASEKGRELLDARLEHINKPLTTNEYPRNKDDAPHKLL